MKKTYALVLIGSVLIAASAAFFAWNYISKSKPDPPIDDVYSFQLSDYEWELKNCAYDQNVGPVLDKDTAIKKAKELWVKEFGPYDPEKEGGVVVSFDEKNDCWRVNGTSHNEGKNFDGGVPEVLIKTDGTVLAMWH